MTEKQLTRGTGTGHELALLAPAEQVDEILREYKRRRAALEPTRFDRVAFGLWVGMLVAVTGFLAAVAVGVVLDATGVAF
ncbi:MAG TPA: hypothetical protein VK915_11195 [Gaiellaceae bacterium]|nr:hypothetical protein [Gaiellaceae bacterium]